MAVTQLPKTAATKEQEQVETRMATGEAAAAFLAGGSDVSCSACWSP